MLTVLELHRLQVLPNHGLDVADQGLPVFLLSRESLDLTHSVTQGGSVGLLGFVVALGSNDVALLGLEEGGGLLIAVADHLEVRLLGRRRDPLLLHLDHLGTWPNATAHAAWARRWAEANADYVRENKLW